MSIEWLSGSMWDYEIVLIVQMEEKINTWYIF